jgi:hypothetical protein
LASSTVCPIIRRKSQGDTHTLHIFLHFNPLRFVVIVVGDRNGRDKHFRIQTLAILPHAEKHNVTVSVLQRDLAFKPTASCRVSHIPPPICFQNCFLAVLWIADMLSLLDCPKDSLYPSKSVRLDPLMSSRWAQ